MRAMRCSFHTRLDAEQRHPSHVGTAVAWSADPGLSQGNLDRLPLLGMHRTARTDRRRGARARRTSGIGRTPFHTVDPSAVSSGPHPLVYTCFSALGMCMLIGFACYVRDRWPRLFDRTTWTTTLPASRSVPVPLAWLGSARSRCDVRHRRRQHRRTRRRLATRAPCRWCVRDHSGR